MLKFLNGPNERHLRDPLIFAMIGLFIIIGALFTVAILSDKSSAAFHVPWFIPSADLFLLIITASVAYLAFGRFRVSSDSISFWMAIGSSGFAIGILFHFLTFPNVLGPGESIIGQLSRTTAWHISLGEQVLAIALLLTSIAKWPRQNSFQGPLSYLALFLWLGGFSLINLMIVLLEKDLPALIGPHEEFSPLLVAWESLMGVLSGLGAYLSIRRYLQSGERLCGYIGMFQIVILYIACISSFTEMVRFGFLWHMLFVGWVGGFALVFIGLLNEYVHLFRGLSVSEAKFRAVFEQAAVGIGRVRISDSHWLDINEAACRMLGLSKEEMLATPWTEITHPDDIDLDVVPFKKMTAGELKTYTIEKRFIHKLGYHVWARLTLSLVRDIEGRPDYEIAVIEDISAAKNAHEALAQMHAGAQVLAERVQLALAAGAFIGCWVWDIESDQMTVDERFAEYFGLDKTITLEKMFAIVHPEDVQGLRRAIREAMLRGGTYGHEYRVKGRDGIYQWVQANGRVELNTKGVAVRFPGVLIDIEQRRGLESERDRISQLLRAFIDAVPGVVYAKDREGRILVANQGVTELVGLPPEKYLGKTDLEFLERKDQARAVMENDQRIMNGGKAETVEEEVNFPDGRRAVWLSTKAPFKDAQGRVIGLIGSSVDITERKEMEKKLQAALKTRDEFLSIASHELNTPLTSILLQTQALRRGIEKGRPDAYSPEKMNRLIDQTDKQMMRLTRIVEDMLDISRIRSGRLTIKKESFDICEMVKDVIERMKGELVASLGALPQITMCEGLIGTWDRTRLEQVLINLLTNAMRYGKGSPVEVRLMRPDADHVRLSVIDHGIGIAKEDSERIFNRFERAVPASEVSGLGLGLSISYEIIQAHKGRIWVESEPGQGTIFNVELPLKMENNT